MNTVRLFSRFVDGQPPARAARQPRSTGRGSAFLSSLIVSGGLAYAGQLRSGLIVTAMRDQVSWGFYIGNFTFLVGVAAAAVVLVIPAYVYDWKPIREIVVYGELLAVSAIIMCLLFVLVDIGRPERFWHLLPVVGHAELPAVDPGVGRARPEHLLPHQLHRRHAHPLSRVHGPALQHEARRAAGSAVDPHGGRHPHGDGVPLQRARRAPLLELVDPRAAVPRLGLLLRARDPAHRAAGAAPVHDVRDPGPGHLEDRRVDGLRDVPESVPARRRGVQGVLLGHRAPAVHALLVRGARRASNAGAVRLGGGDAERRGVRAVHRSRDSDGTGGRSTSGAWRPTRAATSRREWGLSFPG